MRSCLSIALSAIVTVAVPEPANADEPAEPAAVTIVRYDFNGLTESIPDESGNGHNLRVLSVGGGRVRPVVHGPGTALAFPGR